MKQFFNATYQHAMHAYCMEPHCARLAPDLQGLQLQRGGRGRRGSRCRRQWPFLLLLLLGRLQRLQATCQLLLPLLRSSRKLLRQRASSRSLAGRWPPPLLLQGGCVARLRLPPGRCRAACGRMVRRQHGLLLHMPHGSTVGPARRLVQQLLLLPHVMNRARAIPGDGARPQAVPTVACHCHAHFHCLRPSCWKPAAPSAAHCFQRRRRALHRTLRLLDFSAHSRCRHARLPPLDFPILLLLLLSHLHQDCNKRRRNAMGRALRLAGALITRHWCTPGRGSRSRPGHRTSIAAMLQPLLPLLLLQPLLTLQPLLLLQLQLLLLL